MTAEEEIQLNPAEVLESIGEYAVSCDDFEMKKTIGRGAYGEVFFAVHRETGKKVAVKRLTLEQLDGQQLLYFCREVMVLANCNNYFLLPFLGFSPTPPYAIVTQYVSRGSLFDALRHRPNSPRLGPQDKLLAIMAMARGMLSLHRQSIIHRDLKSLNVLLDEDLLPKICDFGIARYMGDYGELVTKQVGTPQWMAPELILGQNYTNKVDVYSFGVIVWEILTEQIPWKDKNTVNVALMVSQNKRPEIPGHCPVELKKLITACWNQDPSKRPSFAQIVRRLAQKMVCFPSGTADCIDGFMERFPFSLEEVEDITTGGIDPSTTYGGNELPDWTPVIYQVKEGETSPVDISNKPLGGAKADLARFATLLTSSQKGSLIQEPSDHPEFILGDNFEPYSYESHDSTSGSDMAVRPNDEDRLPPPPPLVERPPPVSVAPSHPMVAKPVRAAPMSQARVAVQENNVFLKDLIIPKREDLLEYMSIPKNLTTPDKDNIFVRKKQVRPLSAFHDRSKSLTQDNAEQFFQDMFQYVAHGKSNIGLTKEVSVLLKFQPWLVPFFLKTPWVGKLELNLVMLFDANLRILMACVPVMPSVLTVELLQGLLVHVQTRARAEHFLSLISMVVDTHYARIPSANDIIKLVLANCDRFFRTERFVDLVFSIAKDSRFGAFIESCISVFVKGITKEGDKVEHLVVRECFHALCEFDLSPDVIPLSCVLEKMKSRQYISECLELLSHLRSLTPSAELVDALVSVGTAFPLTTYCCCRLTTTSSGVDALLANQAWMTADQFAVSQSVIVFLALWRSEENRERLRDCSNLPAFFARVVSDGSDEDMNAVMLVVRRFVLTKEFIARLDKGEFFEVLATKGLANGSDRKKQCAVLLFDACARISWADGYVHFIKYLPELCKLPGGIAQRAVIPALVMVRDQKQPFLDAGVAKALEKRQMGGQWKDYKNELIHRLGI